MNTGEKEISMTPQSKWITLFDPESQPGLSFAEREPLLLSQAKSVTQTALEPKSASWLPQVLESNPLYQIYDPTDDELEVQLICKIFFSDPRTRHFHSCVEYDSRL